MTVEPTVDVGMEVLLNADSAMEREPEAKEPLRALVVDDEPDIREAVSVMLEELGVDHVVAVTDGLEALDAINGTMWDVVLLDLLMPRLDGFGVLNGLREMDQSLRPRRVVVMSAHVRATVASAIRTLGADDLLVKPIELDDLAAKIGIGDR